MENHKNSKLTILREQLTEFQKLRSTMSWSTSPPKKEPEILPPGFTDWKQYERSLPEEKRINLTLERHSHLKPLKLMNSQEILHAVKFLDTKPKDHQLGKFTCSEWKEAFQKELLYREAKVNAIFDSFSQNNLIFCKFVKGEFKITNTRNTITQESQKIIQEPVALQA